MAAAAWKGMAGAALAAFAFAAIPGRALAHPHVWVTVRSHIAFSPDGKVSAVVHDWTFDEMYSSFAVQGLAKPGELAKREDFAPLAKENAGGLAQIGYFTTLKIGGKAVDFGEVTDYWMEERPGPSRDFPCRPAAEDSRRAPGKYFSLLVADPEFFIDFEFDDKDGVTLARAVRLLALGRQAQAAWRPTRRASSPNRSSAVSRPAPISASRWRAARIIACP